MNHTGFNPQNNTGTKAVAIIPARLASTRLPGKALLEIDGQPMIFWVIRRALAARNVGRVIVATDSEQIFKVVTDAGFEAVMTDTNHNSGTDRIAEVAANLSDAEVIVNVQGDEPMISSETIEGAVEQMFFEIASDSGVGIVTTWESIESTAEVLNPSVVKVVASDDDVALYFSRAPIPFPRDATQRFGEERLAIDSDAAALKQFRKHTGLYVYRRDVLLKFTKWAPTKLEQFERLEQLRALEHGVKIRVIQASSSSIGVDTAEDLERVRELVAQEKFALTS